ncbi:signal peptidase I [Chelatococcus asaccharovorans]|uniref:Signal peptidase I n=2 Tax=Chelatococcus asaccharovorans TaxID=28210 RepID=A0A2V3TZR9_9HYPH|nr:signal peptidase I [Chelatococcus asaccharovorans]
MWPNYPKGSTIEIIPVQEWQRPIVTGDVIAFLPEQYRAVWIKRVAAVGGDKVQMKKGVLYVNDKPIDRKRLPNRDYIAAGKPKKGVACFSEQAQAGPFEVCEIAGETGYWDTTYVNTVPPDSYFVLGDNRDNSTDSRDDRVGFVDRKSVLGVVAKSTKA